MGRRTGLAGEDLAGQVFGRLTVLEKCAKTGRKGERIHWVCRCGCGTYTKVAGADLRAGRVRSCGCLQQDKAAAVGRSNRGVNPYRRNTPEYRAEIQARLAERGLTQTMRRR
jgi:hypothetical protein